MMQFTDAIQSKDKQVVLDYLCQRQLELEGAREKEIEVHLLFRHELKSMIEVHKSVTKAEIFAKTTPQYQIKKERERDVKNLQERIEILKIKVEGMVQ